MIGVFNRSHYEDVLVVRVENIVPELIWRKRYGQINEFEELLSETGTKILKFFLHISLDEQKERFQDRLDVPEKHWKFSLDDLNKRKKWDQYMDAYEEMPPTVHNEVRSLACHPRESEVVSQPCHHAGGRERHSRTRSEVPRAGRRPEQRRD